MKSWYDLTKKEAKELEKEFLTHEVAKEENKAMHLQIMLGVFVLVLCTLFLNVIIIADVIKPSTFILLVLGIILGIIIVVMSTIEYHIKFNSWLLVKHKIVKK